MPQLFRENEKPYLSLNALEQGRLKWSPEVKPLAGLGGTQKKRKQYRSISSPHHPQFHTKSHKLKI